MDLEAVKLVHLVYHYLDTVQIITEDIFVRLRFALWLLWFNLRQP